MNTKHCYLFVYGTLMRASQHEMSQLLKQHSTFISPAYLIARLYQIHHYPGAVLSDNPDDKVFGELYDISANRWLLQRLDDYEECSAAFTKPHEYSRTQVQIYMTEKHFNTAWTYLYNYPVRAEQQILSGDFFKR